MRAKVLNRDVAVISSYQHVKTVLSTPEHSAALAYDELMAPFFPPPNLLLTDKPAHHPMKMRWKSHMDALMKSSDQVLRPIILAYINGLTHGSYLDLYDSMKGLSRRLIQAIFLGQQDPGAEDSEICAEIERLQEDLLRGQFSLFPVSVNAKLWRSPRSRGLHARQKLQTMFHELDSHAGARCPFSVSPIDKADEIANHMLLFTSSLAVKALASLLTAYLLNLFDSPFSYTLREEVLAIASSHEQDDILRRALIETERLSPPVVGGMRRTLQDVILPSSTDEQAPTLVPKGWDLWLYFVSATRDPAVFGASSDTFDLDRHKKGSSVHDPDQTSFAFGAGPKTCLGQSLVREIALNVAKAFLGLLDGPNGNATVLNVPMEDIPSGVRGWLGWQANISPEDWAKDVKQLPIQRPKKPIMVQIQPLHRHMSAAAQAEQGDEFYDAVEYL